MLAESEIEKIKMLNNEKIEYLEGQLTDMAASTAKDKKEKEEAYKNKLN